MKQSLRASLESYSIKTVEKLYGFERTADVSGGDESVVRFEEWPRRATTPSSPTSSATTRKTAARRSRCTRLLSLRPRGCPGAFLPRSARRARRRRAGRRAAALEAELLEGAEEGRPGACSAISSTTTSARRGPWWARFRWPQLDDDELIADRTAIGVLVHDGNPPVVEGQSHAYRMSFPSQEHKLGRGVRPGHAGAFPASRGRQPGRSRPARDGARGGAAAPRADPGRAGPGRGQARGADALRPCLRGRGGGTLSRGRRGAGAPARPTRVSASTRSSRRCLLGESYLFVQGPPGSGKTQGARMAIALMRGQAGRRHLAQPQGDLQHAAGDPARGRPAGLHIRVPAGGSTKGRTRSSRAGASSRRRTSTSAPTSALVAGTAWALTRPAIDVHAAKHPLDVLIVDEAGQSRSRTSWRRRRPRAR